MSAKPTTKTVGAAPANVARAVEPKTIAAVVLIVLMVVLWGRVLLRSKTGPASAKAAAADQIEELSSREQKIPTRVDAVPLKVIAGRNDTIAVDFFRADRYSIPEEKQTPAEQSNRSGADAKILDEIRNAMTLEAVIKNAKGVADKACINGTVVAVGSTLQIFVQDKAYSVRVEGIKTAGVQVNWQGRTVILKMPEQ